MPSGLMLIPLLPPLLAIIGLFIGPWLAGMMGGNPHRSKVWGAALGPLLTLPWAPESALPVPLMVSVGAALGAGLTAHSSMRQSVAATVLAVILSLIGAIFVIGS